MSLESDLEKKFKWWFSMQPDRFFQKTSNRRWFEQDGMNRIEYVFYKFYGNDVILYHERDELFVQLTDDKALLAYYDEEFLEVPNSVYNGNWVRLFDQKEAPKGSKRKFLLVLFQI